MKTDGLSINLATVRQQFGLKDGIEACLKQGITAIAPWRDHIQATGLNEAARIISGGPPMSTRNLDKLPGTCDILAAVTAEEDAVDTPLHLRSG